jgi:LacI family transcriptional regulator
VLEQSPELLGRLAAQRLFARLDGDRSDPVNTVIPVRLVARGSGEVVPAGSPDGTAVDTHDDPVLNGQV